MENREASQLLAVQRLDVRFGAHVALRDVSFDLAAGETVGLVGESGSGKSTLARAVLQLIPQATGEVLFEGVSLPSAKRAHLRRLRRNLQMVFQNPLGSLNPRMSVAETLAEPLKIHEPGLSARARAWRIAEMLERVDLVHAAHRLPHEFSGGQCQRIGIARAMMSRPKLLICDEPVSSLDVSIQGQIINLLMDLQRESGMAMLFISHNLAVVRQMSHRVLVIYRGRLVESATRDALFDAPAHPYTRALLAAVPAPQRIAVGATPPDAREERTPDSGAGGEGCAWYPRCTRAIDACAASVPRLEEVAPGHAAACHRRHEVVYS